MKLIDFVHKNKVLNIHHSFMLKHLLHGNRFIGDLPLLKNSAVIFKGKNNILVCGKGVTIENSEITFEANNSLIYLAHGIYRINAFIHNNSVIYIGKNNYFNGTGVQRKIFLSEGKNLFIGDNNLFSFGITIRNADPHLIYDEFTHKRINFTKSIYIGDHVWIGQDVMILKNSQIHSGSIIGAKSLVANKDIGSNEIWAGVPAIKRKENIFWEGACVHGWTEKETQKYLHSFNNNYIYDSDENTLSFSEIETGLTNCSTPYDKYIYLKNLPCDKNRFSTKRNNIATTK